MACIKCAVSLNHRPVTREIIIIIIIATRGTVMKTITMMTITINSALLMLYFNTVLNTTIYNHLTGVYIKSWQHVSVVHSTIIRP